MPARVRHAGYREPAVALAAGAVSAGIYVWGLSLTISGVFLLLLTPLPLWLAGLGRSAFAAGLAGVAATTAVMLAAGPFPAAMYAALFAIPTVVLAHLAMQRRGRGGDTGWFPGHGLLGALLAIGLVQALCAALALAATEAGFVGSVRDNLVAVFRLFDRETAAPDAGALADRWGPLVLGSILAAVLVAQGATGALAQGLLVRFGRALRPTPPFRRLSAAGWTHAPALALLAAVLALDATGAAGDGGAFALYLAMAFLLVLGVGFLLQGLAVMHALTHGLRFRPLLLSGVYAVVLVMQPFGAGLFATIGFLDRWGNFRARFGADIDADEED